MLLVPVRRFIPDETAGGPPTAPISGCSLFEVHLQVVASGA
jgi:hypothetical protein